MFNPDDFRMPMSPKMRASPALEMGEPDYDFRAQNKMS